ncbi:LytTR family DNA-binding domain-containing protein [Radiobacillus kanasensis]|uniref:LytR/AlgR family response regulator transcription factor n=1 Tax=Radiobacillus kanasensis TaxID=2844358 RepID=UPI001E5FC532|nr:LytTR family DNA-binding domain-containing protein [Radiobacillus kanasensis]UFU00297.1 LytTR family DNA-binding domain-containing protein [Radiobacillus kanasensis]
MISIEKYKVIVGEDNVHHMEILLLFLEDLTDIEVVAEVGDGEELVKQTLKRKPDFLLVDISMPKIDGLSAIKECMKVLPHLKVIFITGYSEYAVDAFDVSAIDYIVKPIESVRLLRAIEKVKQAIHATNSNDLESAHRLSIKQGRCHYFIDKIDILFLEKVEHAVHIHTKDKILKTTETLEHFDKMIGKAFLRTHRSYIVNTQHLDFIERSGKTFLVHFKDYDKHAYVSSQGWKKHFKER